MHIDMNRTTKRTQELLLLLRDEGLRGNLLTLFNEDPVGFSSTPESLERVHFAAINLALRGAKYFESAKDLYRTDVRDLLMAAGFGESLQAHNIWFKELTEVKGAGGIIS